MKGETFIQKSWRLIRDPGFYFRMAGKISLFNNMSDEKYLKFRFRALMGYSLNLENPQTFCEKLNWLKLYDRKPLYTQLVDKCEVKKYVTEKIGEQYVVPLYGVYDSFDEIDFDKLPNQFVLKCTHDSGGRAICTDKSTFDFVKAKKDIEASLKRKYYYSVREWAYKNVKPRIIAEKYMDSLGKPESVEYKLTCFDGKVGYFTVCKGIAHADFSDRYNDTFDRELNHMPWYAYYKNSPDPVVLPKQLDEMIEISEKLSEGIPQVRVDLYIHNDQVYFGEMTFYTWGGIIEFTPKEWDRKLGDYIKLPRKSQE